MRRLERIYSKTERIVARPRFSGWTFLRELFVAAILGGIIAVLWIYGDTIEQALDPSFAGSAKYLSEANLKWAMLGCGLFVVLLLILHVIDFYMRIIIITEDKFVYKAGLLSSKSIMLPLNEIRYVDVSQNFVQAIFGCGKIKLITEGEAPFVIVIKNIVRPQKCARRLMQQCSYVRESTGRPRLCLSIAPPAHRK